MDFWDFPGTLRWKYGGGRIRSQVAWIFRLGSFLLKCSHLMHWHDPFEFAPSNYFRKSREKIESSFSALWFCQNLGFSETGPNPSQTVPDGFFWLENSLVVAGDNGELGTCWPRYQPKPSMQILINLGARGWVRGPWEGPWWFVLIEKLSGMALFDVWKGFDLVFVHFRQLFLLVKFYFLCVWKQSGWMLVSLCDSC